MRPNTNINARNIQNTDELLLSDRYKQEYKYNMGDLARFVRYKPQVIIVAKSGGDYTSIQAGINSIKDASTSKIYTVLALPGEYDEAITLKNYVNIIAIDPFNTYILRQVTDNGVPVHCNLKINIDNRHTDKPHGTHGLYLTANSIIRVDGNIRGSSNGGYNGGYGVYNYSAGIVTVINGDVTGGYGTNGTGYGIYNNSGGKVTVLNGRINTLSGFLHPIYGGDVVLENCIIYGSYENVFAIYAPSTKNVKLMNVWSNRALGANITNLIADGFHVDANVEI